MGPTLQRLLSNPALRLLHSQIKDDMMGNTQVSTGGHANRSARRGSTLAAVLLILPLALAASGALAQAVDEGVAPVASDPVVEPAPVAPAEAAPAEAAPVAEAPHPVEPAPAVAPSAPTASQDIAPVAAPDPAPAPTAEPAPVIAQDPAVPAPLPAPAATPAPAPLPPKPVFVNESHAIERQLGARCPNDLAARLATQGDLLIGACQGSMPAHLAAVLLAIPEAQIHLSRSTRERQLSQRAWFKAVPGAGERPDFMAVQGDMWIRSFEGADPDSTVYLISAPFDCADGRALDVEAARPMPVSAGDCRQAYLQERVYRATGNGAPLDITAEVMPSRPVFNEADRKRYAAQGAQLVLDRSKLQYGPAMRWVVRLDTPGEAADARSYGEWKRAHLGFVVWNGERFVLRDTVPRNLWACDPVAPGDPACAGYADAGRDPFIVADTALLVGEGTAP